MSIGVNYVRLKVIFVMLNGRGKKNQKKLKDKPEKNCLSNLKLILKQLLKLNVGKMKHRKNYFNGYIVNTTFN